MYHTVEMIADSRFLDRDIAHAVATENQRDFSVVFADDTPFISTFYADKFVDTVRAVQGSESAAIRLRRINELHPSNQD